MGPRLISGGNRLQRASRPTMAFSGFNGAAAHQRRKPYGAAGPGSHVAIASMEPPLISGGSRPPRPSRTASWTRFNGAAADQRRRPRTMRRTEPYARSSFNGAAADQRRNRSRRRRAPERAASRSDGSRAHHGRPPLISAIQLSMSGRSRTAEGAALIPLGPPVVDSGNTARIVLTRRPRESHRRRRLERPVAALVAPPDAGREDSADTPAVPLQPRHGCDVLAQNRTNH